MKTYSGIKRLQLYLIKPSRYDDDGYVVRHWRGVLPSNTLACLAGLTEDLRQKKAFGPSLKIKLHLLDETVEHIPVGRICRSHRNRHTKTVVCLAGVQTNQFPRAVDLAREFRHAGLTVMIGGFHVSGALELSPEIPAEVQELLDLGVTVVKGEVEDTWGDLLRDTLTDNLEPLYDFVSRKPDLYDQPLPIVRKDYLRKFVASNFGTIDCGRGCPFECGFCTIIHVQGRKVRYRSAERIAAAVRDNYLQRGVNFYFFTDDNFARNKNWEPIFDLLIHLREKEKIPVSFMMQADVLSWKIPNFIEKARRAGCLNVFIGMESINPDNLKATGKNQNHVDEYPQLIEAYRSREISVHASYIIGFPNDTPESVRRDLDYLENEVRPDHVSFFMLMPLPGSKDHMEMVRRGEWMNPDYNLYDSDHPVTRHPHLKDGLWTELYHEAWHSFYSLENMKKVLQRSSQRNYWNNLVRFMWCKNSIQTEKRHPMMCGLFQLKKRKDRRPGYPVQGWWEFFKMRIKEVSVQLVRMFGVVREMQEVWLQTRQSTQAERLIAQEINRICATARGSLKLADIQLAHLRTKVQLPSLKVPSKLRLFWTKWYPALSINKVYTRQDLDCFWQAMAKRWNERKWFHIPLHRVFGTLFREAQISLLFTLHILYGMATNPG